MYILKKTSDILNDLHVIVCTFNLRIPLYFNVIASEEDGAPYLWLFIKHRVLPNCGTPWLCSFTGGLSYCRVAQLSFTYCVLWVAVEFQAHCTPS